jgi:TMEM175 potassium channel family protein
MNTARLEAFTDGVMAIIITITVLEFRSPASESVKDFWPMLPMLLIYAWSFQTVGTYWNNHHHLLHATRQVSPGIMWANLHLLFWLSLIPFTTEWLGRHFGARWPTAAYCAVLLLAGIAYNVLEQAIMTAQGSDKGLAAALGRRVKEVASLVIYATALALAFVAPWASYVLVVSSLAVWLVPNRRLGLRPDT